ncbi:hypothetical protein JCM10213_004470 [Rhodosporidiobolus nylandii]
MAPKPIFYDLVGVHGGPFFSPNTWKVRLSLLHKGIDFEERELTYLELKEFGPKMGVERPMIPFLELPDGKFIWDSWKIAEWLDENYPDKPSLFLPDAPTPVKPNEAGYKLAKTFARTINVGYGDSDSQWSTFFELSAEGIAGLMPDLESGVQNPNRLYFTSDAKLGGKDAYKKLLALETEPLVKHATSCLLPLEAVLGTSPFLTGEHPGFADYIVYGRYHMMRAACPAISSRVWKAAHLPHVAAWLQRTEKRWEEQLKGAMARLPAL